MTSGAHDFTPEVASDPLKATLTLRLYQPFRFGWRSGIAATLGAVASYWKPKDVLVELPALSVQLPEIVAVPVSGPV